MTLARRVGVAFVLLAAAGCEDNSTDAESEEVGRERDAQDTSEESTPESGIGPAGGVVSFGPATLTIPEGALADFVEIRLIETSESAPFGLDLISPVYRAEPAGLEFLIPATISLPLLLPSDEVHLYWASSEGDYLEIGEARREGDLISGEITLLSGGFAGRPSDGGCDGVARQACGGCAELEGEPGTNCGENRQWLCVGPDSVSCELLSVCGNGIAEGFERCDTFDLRDEDCISRGFDAGVLNCTEQCELDAERCVGSDPCAVLECSVAPPDECDGDRALSFQPAGVCVAGQCEFSYDITNCAADGGFCVDGTCVNEPRTSDLIVTEFLADPEGTDDNGEWFEVYNASGRALNLNGLLVRDSGSDSFVVGRDLLLADGEYAVFAETMATVAGAVDFAWNGVGEFSLANSDDEIEIVLSDVVVDRIAWSGSWTVESGASTSLGGPQIGADNAQPSLWCLGATAYGATANRGTPGSANPACAGGEPVCGNAVIESGEQCDDGNPNSGDGCSAGCRIEATSCAGGCDSPPPNYCEGSVSVRYVSAGRCVAESCVYDASNVDCSTFGQDCSAGNCVTSGSGSEVNLVISEVMINPEGSENRFEWFEIYNAGASSVDLRGLTITDDGSDEIYVSARQSVAPGQYFVFGKNNAAVPGGVDFDWTDSDFALGNSGDEIIIELDGRVLDRISWTGANVPESGFARQLSASSLNSAANDLAANWCSGEGDYGVANNFGTPGASNRVCR